MRSVLYGLLICVVAFAATPSPVPSNAKNDAKIAAALEQLQRYKISHSLSDLHAAITTLEGADNLDAYGLQRSSGPWHVRSTLPPDVFNQRRRAIVAAWIEVIKAIDGAYDKTYNPYDMKSVPTDCVLPEDGSVTCNVDPLRVADPVKRAAYAAALAENERKLQRSYYYSSLQTIDGLAMTLLKATIDLLRKVAPEGVSDDFSALDAMVREAGLSNVRRALIDAYFYATPIPSHTPQPRSTQR